jgi:putative ABC transport system permease protein
MRFITVIFRNLMRRGVRSVLTVLGLGIGIAAVVSLIGISWGFEHSFTKLYEAKSIDLVVVKAGVADRLTSNLPLEVGEKLLKIEGVQQIAGTLTDVQDAAASRDGKEEVKVEGVMCNGWEADSLLFRGIRLLSGRTLQPSDKGKKVAMIGRVLAMNLDRKVGDSLEVSRVPYQVIGIFESDSLFENGGLIEPLDVLQKAMGRQDSVSGFVVVARNRDRASIEALSKRIEKEVPDKENGITGVAAVPARDYIQGDLQVRLVKAMAFATSVIALLLGSLGVLNTMMMAVFERTREIGVLRALGWRRPRVLGLILGEAMCLGLLGAAVGAALGVAGVRALQVMPTASAYISPELPLSVLILGGFLGIGLSALGGVYPALRAAALNPTEALHHE